MGKDTKKFVDMVVNALTINLPPDDIHKSLLRSGLSIDNAYFTFVTGKNIFDSKNK